MLGKTANVDAGGDEFVARELCTDVVDNNIVEVVGDVLLPAVSQVVTLTDRMLLLT